jgi:hypothetical protein
MKMIAHIITVISERRNSKKYERILYVRALTKGFGLVTVIDPMFSLAAAFNSDVGDFNPVTAGRDGFRCATRFIGTMATGLLSDFL